VATAGGSIFYIADTGNHTIRKLVFSGDTATVTTIAGAPGQPGLADAGGTNARFHSPRGLALDSYINLYVADAGNHAVRKISSINASAVTTLGADTPGGVTFVSPRGIAVDDSRKLLYVSDADTHAIYASDIGISGTGGDGRVFVPIAGAELDADIRDGPALSARFNAPWGLAVIRGDLYVADHGNAALRKLTTSGTIVTIALTAMRPGLSVAPARRIAGTGAGSVSFAVTVTGGEPLAWTAALPSGPNWARIASGASGTNNGTITVSLDSNPAGGTQRTATLNITAGNVMGSPATVTIEQAANTGGGNNDNNSSGNSGGGGGGAPTLPALALLAALLALRARKS
jgi:hypothetical protein